MKIDIKLFDRMFNVIQGLPKMFTHFNIHNYRFRHLLLIFRSKANHSSMVLPAGVKKKGMFLQIAVNFIREVLL